VFNEANNLATGREEKICGGKNHKFAYDFCFTSKKMATVQKVLPAF